MQHITWTTEARSLSQLQPAKYNPRRLTKRQADDLFNSLDRFSLADPLVINRDNTIIGGHQRYMILLQKHGPAFLVDCRVPDRQLTDHEERELNLRLNKNLGDWDFDKLANEFDEALLRDVGFEDLPGLGDTVLKEVTEELKPYRKAHILITFDAERFAEVKAAVKSIEQVTGIEVELGAN